MPASPTRRIARPTGDGGFSLAEVIVSFGLFAIVATAASFVFVNGIRVSHANTQRVAAANLAQNDIAAAQAAHARTQNPPPADYPATASNDQFRVVREVTSCGTEGPHKLAVHTQVFLVRSGAEKFMARSDTILACS